MQYAVKNNNGMHIPDYEEILLVNNGVTQASISFTNALRWDEKGIRAALTWNHFDQNFLTKPYNQLVNYNSLIFSETQEKVNYSDDYQKINCLPSKEKINTMFELNGCTISKEEWVSFGKHSSLTNAYELIQTYAITDSLVNNDTIRYYLNNNYAQNKVEKACYETFLTALSTIWMYDGFVNNLSDYYNVSYGRNNFVVSMCGMEYGNASYIHCPNPLMGISVSGDSWINVYIVKYLSSLMLGEIESAVLNMAGGHCHSSVHEIFSGILNFENFTLLCDENNLTIYLNNNPNYKFIIDLKNGIVYDLSFFNGFIYKGAVSTDFTYCYCYNKISNNLDDLTHEKYVSPYDLNNNNLLTDDEWHAIEDFMGEIALAGSSAATLTVIELILAGSILFPLFLFLGVYNWISNLVGIALKSDANGGDYGKAVYDSLTSIVLNGI